MRAEDGLYCMIAEVRVPLEVLCEACHNFPWNKKN